MKTLCALSLAALALSTSAHATTFCFNEAASAGETAAADQFAGSRIAIYQARGASYTNGDFIKTYNRQSYNTYQVSGTATKGQLPFEMVETSFSIDVDMKAGTCQLLGTTLTVGESIILK